MQHQRSKLVCVSITLVFLLLTTIYAQSETAVVDKSEAHDLLETAEPLNSSEMNQSTSEAQKITQNVSQTVNLTVEPLPVEPTSNQSLTINSTATVTVESNADTKANSESNKTKNETDVKANLNATTNSGIKSETSAPTTMPTTLKVEETTAAIKIVESTPKSEVQVKTLCTVCKCPDDKSVKPYVIDCSRKNMSAVPEFDSAIKKLPQVALDFSYGQFKIFPVFGNISNVVSLVFDHNQIDSIPGFPTAGLFNLKSLSLADNKLRIIHRSALCGKNKEHLPLEILNLNGNSFSTLDENLFECINMLKQLNLANNNFTRIDHSTQISLNNLFGLQHLDLSGNKLEHLPDELIQPLSKLHTLNLAKNNFDTVPSILSKTKLQELSLDENPIKFLTSSSFTNMSSIVRLNISHMPSLTQIGSGTFQPLHNLTHLRCSNNPSLSTIEPLAFNSDHSSKEQNLELMDLSKNNMSIINEDIFLNIHIHNMDIRNNPIICSCYIYWVTMKKEFEMDSEIMEQTTCFNRENNETISILKVDFEYLKCSKMSVSVLQIHKSMAPSYVFLLTMLIIVVFLVVGVLVFLVKTQREKRYRALDTSVSVRYNNTHDNSGFESINCDEVEEYSRHPSSNIKPY